MSFSRRLLLAAFSLGIASQAVVASPLQDQLDSRIRPRMQTYAIPGYRQSAPTSLVRQRLRPYQPVGTGHIHGRWLAPAIPGWREQSTADVRLLPELATYVLLLPERDIALVLLANRKYPNAERVRLAQQIVEALQR